jgi:hypothetical protein
LVTGIFSPEVDVEKYVGYCDLDNYNAPVIDGNIKNGIAMCSKEAGVYFQIYNNGVLVEEVERANWNFDKLDGNGPSGMTLNMLYGQIVFMDLEWLGLGTVRAGFALNGTIINCHLFHHANVLSQDVYMRTANLPIMYMIKSTGGSGSMKQICNTVISEGGFNPEGNKPSIVSNGAISVLSGDEELVLGIRLKEASFDATVIPLAVKIINLLDASGEVTLGFNPTYTGTVTWTDLPTSSIQVAYNNNNEVTDRGLIQFADFVGASKQSTGTISGQVASSVKIGKDLYGNYDELWVMFKADGDSSVKGILEIKDLL